MSVIVSPAAAGETMAVDAQSLELRLDATTTRTFMGAAYREPGLHAKLYEHMGYPGQERLLESDCP